MGDSIADFFNKRPGMGAAYCFQGTFNDYVDQLVKKIHCTEQNTLLRKCIVNKVERIFPGIIDLKNLAQQLKDYPIISAADHHGLLNYKLLYNSNLVYSALIKNIKQKYLVVLATGDISLNNDSFPRGFFFKGQKVNFFSKKESTIPVHLIDRIVGTHKTFGIECFMLNLNSLDYTEEEKKFLEYLFFNSIDVKGSIQRYSKFSDQISYLNYHLWKLLFHKDIRGFIPDMVYIQSNYLINCIFKEEIKQQNSIISKILFDKEVIALFLKNFNGITSCWDDNSGTHFFWGISEKKKIFPLRYDSESHKLVAANYELELNVDVIIDALDKNEIRLSNYFYYLTTTFLGGYTALGGFNQIEYLPQMQKAHVKTLREIGMHDLADQFASRVTDGLICGMTPFHHDSAIDMIWHYNSTNGKFNGNLDNGITQEELDRVNNMSVREMIHSAIETMSGIVT